MESGGMRRQTEASRKRTASRKQQDADFRITDGLYFHSLSLQEIL